MEKSFPFNARYAGAAFDRVYSADDWAAERAAYVTDGVLSSDALQVFPAGGMDIYVSAGNACISGRTYFNTEPLTKTLASSSPSSRRIDLVVLRLDLEAREMKVAVKSSPYSLSPEAPACLETDTVKEIPLAEVLIGLDAAAVTMAEITDRRPIAKYPLSFGSMYEECLAELQATLGLEELSDVGVFTRMLTNAGEGRCALFDDGVYREVPRIVTGEYYLANGADGNVHVTLGVRPKAVYFCRNAHPTAAYENGKMNIYGGFTAGSDQACARVDPVTGETLKILEITDTGFRVYANRDNGTGYDYYGSTYQAGGADGGNTEFLISYLAVI